MRTFVSCIAIAGALVAVSGLTAPTPQAAAPAKRFVDNGDGTVTDKQTGLMWEKKTENNVNDTYTWSINAPAPDGTLFTSFLPTTNCLVSADGNCGSSVANYYDWRIPNISELRSIVDCSQPLCLDPIFGLAATTGLFYWSASTTTFGPTLAWVVFPQSGFVDNIGKPAPGHVRAVRGGR